MTLPIFLTRGHLGTPALSFDCDFAYPELINVGRIIFLARLLVTAPGSMKTFEHFKYRSHFGSR